MGGILYTIHYCIGSILYTIHYCVIIFKCRLVSGLGKGLVGVVARPTGGIVDFASSSFEGIRKATTISQEVTRLRPPRVVQKNGVITPYNYRQAAGNNILVVRVILKFPP